MGDALARVVEEEALFEEVFLEIGEMPLDALSLL